MQEHDRLAGALGKILNIDAPDVDALNVHVTLP
jgi:hypothetical protein